MATIIISLVLLVMAVEEGSSGWYARFNILGTEAKEQASSLAEGCAEQALATLLTDPNYTGNATTTTKGGTCHVFPIQFNSLNGITTPGYATINTQAEVRNSYANLELAMNVNDIHLNSIPAAPTTGTLFITTHVINDSSGTKQAADFAITVSANPTSSSAGSESGNVVTVQPGPFSVNGSAVANYSMSLSSNCSGNISANEVKFCTITYDDITTTLTVIANVVNNNSGTKQPADFPLFIDGAPVSLGQRVTVTAGLHTVSATTLSGYAASVWGYDCAASGEITMALGQNKTCIINFDDLPPPAPVCAETVMMLDRTGSMSYTDLSNEKVAANSLINLYSTVSPLPKMSAGIFGDRSDDNGLAPARIVGQLTTTYSSLTSALNTWLSNSSGYTNLADAITKSSDELNSSRHVAGKEKVLILISDGDPNRPTGTMGFDTGFLSPTINTQNATGELWNNPTGAYADGGTDANDPVSENDRHQFYTFGFGGGSGLPTSATVTGIEAQIDAWATASTTNSSTNVSKYPASVPSVVWTNPDHAYFSDNQYATDSTNGHQQSYSNFGFSIPSNATIRGILVTTEAKMSGGSSQSTPTLYPSGQGYYTAWTNGEATVDETGTPDCSSSDSIIESNSGDRESVTLDLSSIPNGATITDVNITTYDRGDSRSGGSYRTFARIGGSNTDASSDLYTTSTSGCNARNQSIDLPSTLKSISTVLEVGVIKTSSNSNTVRVGAIRAIVTYALAGSGSLSVSLSSNNGSIWTAAKSITLSMSELLTSPAGNSTADLWNKTWAPSDFNNGNFVLRIQNDSPNGTTISLDQVTVNVYYDVPVSLPVACQIGMDLSWNGGTSWTGEKNQTINGTETTYTLGSDTDDWSTTHNWQPIEFSNTNFRARVRAIDPGSGCDNSAIDHLDWLRLKIHYNQNVDASQAALNAADTAKLAGLNIFTIHYGDDPSGYNGRELLANLASGITPVTGHQNGSLSDTSGVVSGNTGIKSPNNQSADTGGSGNGFEVSPTRAFADGPSGTSGAAQNANGAGDRHRYYDYNLSIPPNATINGIATRLDWWLDSTSGSNSLGVQLSWDGGANWTSIKSITDEPTNSSNSDTLGGSTDNWGHTWTAADLSNVNFRVRLIANCTGSSSCNSRHFYLDWVPVTVYYTAIQENGDGDNFFISPTSADMEGIFHFIGEEVCPALLNVTAAPPPTTGTLLIMTQVTNNNSGSKTPADFTMNVTADNPSQTSFAGSDIGVSVTLNPGAYSVTENGVSGYTQSISATCSSAGSSGVIVAGEMRVCIVNNDDLPPPPPPPNLNLETNTWHEVPNPTPN